MEKLSSEYLDVQAIEKLNGNQLAKLSKILLVEDNRVAEKVTKNMLFALHCQVDTALDGKTALELVKQHTYDLVFMDIGLPDINGDEVTRRIRADELVRHSHLPIIALTAHEDSKTQQSCLDAGMNAVLSKPIYLGEVAKILNDFIPARKAWLERQQQLVFDEEKIVDFDYVKQLLGSDEALMTETLMLFVESLPYEVSKFEEAYQQKNWLVIQAIANKLKGGAGYCGALRLKSACAELDHMIEKGLMSQATDAYKLVLTEIAALQKFFNTKTGQH